MPRRIRFENISNFRDLGGYQSSYGETAFNVVFRSGSLNRATAAEVDELANLGIKTIIDFREENEATTLPDVVKNDSRFEYVHFPLNGKLPQNKQEQLVLYINTLKDPSAKKILQSILFKAKPLIIHCTAGKDRTGAFVFLLLLLNGVSIEDINADYMASFPYLEKETRFLLKEDPPFPSVCLTPDVFFLLDFYQEFIKTFGTAEGYCKSIGLSNDEIKGLKNIFGKQEKSCGAVIFNDGKILVEHSRKGHFTIPKGHVESFDKDEMATATREIKEETSLTVSLNPSWKTFTYHSPSIGVFKKCVFFIGESENRETKKQDSEVLELLWLTPDEAIKTITHESEKEVIKKAASFYLKLQK